MSDTSRRTEANVMASKLHIVSIKLTPEQRTEIAKITGETLDELRIGVEELADLGDLVAN